ncbi:MAG: PD-(D/E)XK nuclease family protein [Betaproteobacteria bacterium]|nr:PD-(D/E)XK nuclease family protein [Betaproteobacteria bacterium]
MHSQSGWIVQIQDAIKARKVHPSRCLVLLPYAQLLPLAQQYWAEMHPSGFTPRFETLRSWCEHLAPVTLKHSDLGFDASWDLLTAQSLLKSAGLTLWAPEMAATLLNMARALVPLAAAVSPDLRTQWGQEGKKWVAQTMAAPFLEVESAVAQTAIVWASHSSFVTDALFATQSFQDVDCCLWMPGVQADPIQQVFAQACGDAFQELMPTALSEKLSESQVNMHQCSDISELAERAVACVLNHVQRGVLPLAVVAIDRLLTRRIHALLVQSGVLVKDETGWKLSTTQSGLHVMLALKAMAWNASVNEVLDWVKHAPKWAGNRADLLEKNLRQSPQSLWRKLQSTPEKVTPEKIGVEEGGSSQGVVNGDATSLLEKVNAWRSECQAPKKLAQWLSLLQKLLWDTGQWNFLEQDAAGELLLDVLHLQNDSVDDTQNIVDAPWADKNYSLSDFTQWVDGVLEGCSFVPEASSLAQVHILPLHNLYARPWNVVVLPGCDEVRLSESRLDTAEWPESLRKVFGLPSKTELRAQFQIQWVEAFKAPCVEVLWHTIEASGELIQPSAWVMDLERQTYQVPGQDLRLVRTLEVSVPTHPQPALGPFDQVLMPRRISASSYQDLRACPYRFFAKHVLGLKAPNELEFEIDKRLMGQWLHDVLKLFHEQLAGVGRSLHVSAKRDLIDRMAELVSQQMKLPQEDFVPFQASWPALRDGYLQWLAGHEDQGFKFKSAEVKHEQSLEDWFLVGRIDRVDESTRSKGGNSSLKSSTSESSITWLLDYKTEIPQKTAARIKTPLEDTQLAFYAALMGTQKDSESLRLGYVNVAEREGTRCYEMKEVDWVRQEFVQGLLSDLRRIDAGQSMPALGGGEACRYCEVRGLCRKDFWETPSP